MLEVDADEIVIVTAALDGRPFDDVIGGCTEWVAHVGLLEDFFLASAGAAIGDELVAGEVFVLGAVDDFQEAEIDGVGEGDAVIQIPRGICIFDFCPALGGMIFDWGLRGRASW